MAPLFDTVLIAGGLQAEAPARTQKPPRRPSRPRLPKIALPAAVMRMRAVWTQARDAVKTEKELRAIGPDALRDLGIAPDSVRAVAEDMAAGRTAAPPRHPRTWPANANRPDSGGPIRAVASEDVPLRAVCCG